MPKKNALPVTRAEDFAAWYQAAISEAGLAEESGVRGCMVMLPWGYGIWERIQRQLDDRIRADGYDNCYFPLFIPVSYFEKEAEHVDGFAKEMAVVTHHRLIEDGKGGLKVDPEAELEEPLVVRPTSETMIGSAFSRWIQSWRDLPVQINQWANIVRWEMRTRMFLRTAEFLWQEGHAAYASADEARTQTLKALELYRDVAENVTAIPVIPGRKPAHERFPGAVETHSIEAMMQDGKALQAGTSHYLGTNFAEAQNIRYQNSEGEFEHAHTISWGMTTRMIGALIMVHGDDDGLRVPPKVAPHQIVIVPMLRDSAEDEALLAYCDRIAMDLRDRVALGEPVRVYVDARPGKAAGKRWSWVKKGAPIVLEIGGRDAAGEAVTMLRRDALYDAGGKLANASLGWRDFADAAPALLEEIQVQLFKEASQRLADNIRRDVTDFDTLASHFKGNKHAGWVEIQWSRPDGAERDAIVERLKREKLTMRNIPAKAAPVDGPCFFTGAPAVERILIAKAY